MKTIKSIWFSETKTGRPIGIILCRDPRNGLKSYIGTGIGIDESVDEEIIKDYGSKFPVDAAQALFKGDGKPMLDCCKFYKKLKTIPYEKNKGLIHFHHCPSCGNKLEKGG